MRPLTCVPCPYSSRGLFSAPVKSKNCTALKSPLVGSMPESTTATPTPLPVNDPAGNPMVDKTAASLGASKGFVGVGVDIATTTASTEMLLTDASASSAASSLASTDAAIALISEYSAN